MGFIMLLALALAPRRADRVPDRGPGLGLIGLGREGMLACQRERLLHSGMARHSMVWHIYWG